MTIRLKISAWVLLLITLMAVGCKVEDVRPNIVFILADDLGYSQLGCYGSDYYQTPNLDQLSREGMLFTDAYAACAVCSPTRASIMTGKYPARLHLTDFIAGNTRTDFPLTQPDWQKHLPLEEVTLAEYLKAEGYSTAIFGKWHLSQHKTPPESLPFNPDKQGFDESFVSYKPSGALSQPWQGAEDDAHNVDTITSLAIDFIDRNRSNPFILIVSHNTIHDPLKEKAETVAKYEQLVGAEKPENHPVIAAMIERLDNSCGTILSRIKEAGLEENTIVVFFSDNGGKHAYALQTPLRAGKGWLYEGGIREPLIVKWKGHVEPGSRSGALVSSIDFLPTILEMTGVEKLPEAIDGQSIVPVLESHEKEVHADLYWHYPHYHGGSGMLPGAAIRSGKWKLIEWYEKSLLGEEKSAFELYDLENDMGETRDLSDSLKSRTAELAGKLQKWRTEVNAQMPIPNRTYTEK